MKTTTPQLLSFLQTHNTYGRADLFNITLPNGQQITSTTCAMDLVWSLNPPTTRYYASKFGAWERGAVTSEASYAPKTNTMKLTVVADQDVVYPGTSTSLMATVQAGLFDGAIVKIYTVYWELGQLPQSGIEMGTMTTFVGQIGNISGAARSKVVFDVSDMLYILNRKSPPNLIQSSCRHLLYSPNCTVIQKAYTQTGTVSGGDTLLVSVDYSGTQYPAPYFNHGLLTFTSGQNAGLSFTIKQQTSPTNFTLAAPTPFPVNTGDEVTIIPGCDKTMATCQNVFNNIINYGGQPFVPSPEVAV